MPTEKMTAAEKRFLAFCIVLIVLVHLAMLAYEWRTMRPDFVSLYASGRLALQHGATGNEPLLLPGAPPGAALVLSHRGADKEHTPFELLIFAPLARLNFSSAYLLWYACNLTMLFSVPLLLRKHIPNLRFCFAYVVIVAATFFPVFVTLIQGQDSLLLLLLLTLCYLCLRSGRETMAGVMLALGIFKFTVVLPVVAALVLMKKRRLLGGFAAGAAAMLAVTTAVFGTGAIPEYIRILLHPSGGTIGGREGLTLMANLRGFLEIVAAGRVSLGSVDAATIVLSALIFVFLGRLWWRLAEDPSALDLAYAMVVVAAVLVSYHLFLHDVSVLLLPALLTWNRLAAPGRALPAGLSRLMAGSLLVLYAAPFLCSQRLLILLFFCASALLLGGLYLSAGEAIRLGAGGRALCPGESAAAARGDATGEG